MSLQEEGSVENRSMPQNGRKEKKQTDDPPSFSFGKAGAFLGTYLNHWLKVLSVAALAVAILLAAYIKWVVMPAAPDVSDLQQAKHWSPSIVLAADGTQLSIFRRGQQQWVPLGGISPHVIQALIATEDRRFYEHPGFDMSRTIAALMHTANGDKQGGSTITQQLARNLFPDAIGRSRNATRKLKEIVTAVKIERAYSKEQILETYLNTVPFLYNVYGIEMAAQTYFGKPAAALGPLEAATLVGMLKGTHYYNPVVNPERARARRNTVLSQMVKQGYLPAGQFQALRERPLEIRFNRQPEQSGPSTHFTEYVRRWAMQWAEDNDRDLYTDGLVLHTTLDPAMQEIAEEAVERQAQILQYIADVEWGRRSQALLSSTPSAYSRAHKQIQPFSYFWDSRRELVDAFVRETPQFKKAVQAGSSEAQALAALKQDDQFMAQLRAAKTRLEAGFVAMDPGTGEIKAWVGSRDFKRDQYDHVAQAMRQPGSTFKPIVYGAALEKGFKPDRMYADIPVEIRFADGEVWKPTDMTAPTGRQMTLREGLIHSRNGITAQIMQDTGLPDIVNLAKAIGVAQSRLDPVPSLSLGTSPVTLLEMVTAYSTIAKLGEFRKPVVIKRITDRNGTVIAEFGQEAKRVISEQTAIELIDMMRDVIAKGTGQMVKTQFGITADIAGKTGTTQYNTDGWFIMMHPNLAAGSWVGFNDSRVTMRSNYWGQGGRNAALIVGDFFRSALKEKKIQAKAKFPKPKYRPAPIRNPDTDAFGNRLEADASSGQIVVRREPDGSIFIGDERGAHAGSQENTSKTEDELDRFLSAMGRDPASGVRIDRGDRSFSPSPLTPSQIHQQRLPNEVMPARSSMLPDMAPESFR